MTLCPRRALFLCCATLSLSASVWAATADSSSAVAGTCSLIIHVTGFRNTKGKLGAELFTSSAGWPEDVDKSYRHDHFPIEGDHATARFDHLPPGKYGVVVLHDENENKKLDRNLLQVPKEGFGFANNPHVFLAAPPIEKATIPVTCPSTTTEVHLIYK
ncbi:MAG: hypothetical protein JWM54_1068 [Acidobacteriaceae bacterium]|nr:hypothetical protein [Acidobacteriaceae bacterium]